MKDGITPTIAKHVLYHFCGTGGGGMQAGQFTSLLIEAIACADIVNQHKLSTEFPGYVFAVKLAQNDEKGIAVLQEIATKDNLYVV